MNAFWISIISLISASLILICSLAWNDVALSWFDRQTTFKDPITARLVYAITITIITAVALTLISKRAINKRNVEKISSE